MIPELKRERYQVEIFLTKITTEFDKSQVTEIRSYATTVQSEFNDARLIYETAVDSVAEFRPKRTT